MDTDLAAEARDKIREYIGKPLFHAAANEDDEIYTIIKSAIEKAYELGFMQADGFRAAATPTMASEQARRVDELEAMTNALIGKPKAPNASDPWTYAERDGCWYIYERGIEIGRVASELNANSLVARHNDSFQPRDCGEDMKRLDWLDANWDEAPSVIRESQFESVREAIDAAMKEQTGKP
jgi:hypothetical protein